MPPAERDADGRNAATWQSLRDGFLSALPADAATSVGVVAGCSGGADSVALTLLIVEHFRRCSAANRRRTPPLRIAHFNHALRGAHSEGDEQFVRNFAASLGVEVNVGRPSRSAEEDAEAGLRQDRRQFFHEVASRSGCRYVALAHTADDQAETILHHLLRGTGTPGMAGMRPASPFGTDFVILRPLLLMRRDAIRTALVARGQRWREDASNQSSHYTRNWLRHDVLPIIHTRFPKADEALVRAAGNQHQLGEMLRRLAQQWIEAFVELPDVVGPARGRSTTLRIRRPGLDHPESGHARGSHPPWPHGADLANEHAIIIAACQIAFDAVGWPRGEMNRDHWERLAVAIANEGNDSTSSTSASSTGVSPRSLGHWPGHIEGFQTPGSVVLRTTSPTGGSRHPRNLR